MKHRWSHRSAVAAWAWLALVAACLTAAWPLPAAAETAAATGSALEVQSRALQRASNAVLGVQAQAIEDANSIATLGRERNGSGVVIGADGLVLTIGYLVLEAEQVLLVTDDARRVPARVVAYDVATGFGLVQALVPLRVEPAPLGAAAGVTAQESLMVVSGGEAGAISIAQLISRRAFSGYWEYHLDEALFTAPARRDHSGAGLFNGRGELVGIGSLFVSDGLGPGQPRMPGNMFVPIDLLRPILGELRSRGSSSLSRRPWLGISCVEQDGFVHIVRVSDDSPADVAGLQVGDRILRIDGVEVQAIERLWKTLWRGDAAERDVQIEIQRDGEVQTLTVHGVDRMTTLKRSRGI